MLNTTIPLTVQELLKSFATCFTRPGFENFATMITGWIACQGRHSISRVIQAAIGPAVGKHHSCFYRFLSHGSWAIDSVGRVLFQLLLPHLPKKLTLILDDTLSHKSGPHIFGAAMHYDAHMSTYGRGTAAGSKGFFAFGNNFVVAALWIPLPWNRNRGLAIPILFRLYRSKKLCPKQSYRKRTDMALELVELVAKWLPKNRQLHVVADSEYACRTIVRQLPDGVVFTGPMSMDAALYEQPGPYQGRGRRRVKGKRLLSPKALAESTSIRWKKRTLKIYGKKVAVLTKTQLCLWYTVAGTKLLRMTLTKDPDGRISDRAYFSTEVRTGKTAEGDLLVHYARRWEIEVAFRNTKQAMGLEDPQNGWWRRKADSPRPKKRPGPNPKGTRGEKAVNHTLAMAFAAYAFVVLWYFDHGNAKNDVERVRREAPWYRNKRAPSYNDMLAAVRRELWIERLSQHPVLRAAREKINDLLPHWMLAA